VNPRGVCRVVGRLAVVALALVAVVAIAGCQAILDPEITASPQPTAVRSGIRGIVHLGPNCENATRASPCILPYSAELVIIDADDNVVARVTSGDDGRFEVTLPPGVYTIQPVPPANGDPFPAGDPVSVVVGDRVYTHIGVDYDTGIR
jgi:hypothetical protein